MAVNPQPAGDPARQFITFLVVNPRRARWLLTFNTANRGEKAIRIAGMARDMLAGKFRDDTCEPLKFRGTPEDPEKLQDGQNRLAAVVLAGETDPTISVGFWVAYGVPDSAQLVIDSGAPRNMTDYLALDGQPNARNLAAALRFVWRYLHRELGNTASMPTRAELFDVLRERPSIPESLALGRVFATSTRFGSSGTASGLIYLITDADQDGATAFLSRAITGEHLRAGDPVLVLRNQLARHDPKAQPVEHRAAWVVKAFNAERTGRAVQAFSWKRGTKTREPFPSILTTDEVGG